MAISVRGRLSGSRPVSVAAFHPSKFPFLSPPSGEPREEPPTFNVRLEAERGALLTPYWLVWDGEEYEGNALLPLRLEDALLLLPVEPSDRVVVYSDGLCEVGLLVYRNPPLDFIPAFLTFYRGDDGRVYVRARLTVPPFYNEEERVALGASFAPLLSHLMGGAEVDVSFRTRPRGQHPFSILDEEGLAWQATRGGALVLAPEFHTRHCTVTPRLARLRQHRLEEDENYPRLTTLKAGPAEIRVYREPGDSYALIVERLRRDTWEWERFIPLAKNVPEDVLEKLVKGEEEPR